MEGVGIGHLDDVGLGYDNLLRPGAVCVGREHDHALADDVIVNAGASSFDDAHALGAGSGRKLRTGQVSPLNQ